jgi:GNAT superfamily N-acetyltransferase
VAETDKVDRKQGIVFREAGSVDVPGMLRVRTSVNENMLTREQLAERGITEESVSASLLLNRRGWVAECDGNVVAFSMADRQHGSIFALFVLPEYEKKGLGSRLLDLAVEWLWQSDIERIWLTTVRDTRAAKFYRLHGWVCVGEQPNGEVRFELRRN